MTDKGKNIARREYTVSVAENGYILSSYDIGSDATEYWIAKTPEELGELMIQWQQRNVEGMLKYQTGKQK
ncbi:MAG: hypothetical protein V4563_17885 [Pseudomonadota bacterium]